MATLLNTQVGCVCLGRTATNTIDTTRISTTTTGTGAKKTAIGTGVSFANSGPDNTALGFTAMRNTTSCDNTAIGVSAMYAGGGNGNTAIGSYSLYHITSASENVAVGFKSLCNLTTGGCNTALGYRSGLSIYGGTRNTLIGAFTNSLSNDNRSVAIGYNAITVGGFGGYGNVAIGTASCAIGYFAIAIGANTYAVNTLFWGGPQNNTVNCIYGTWTYNSDSRDKADVNDLNDNLGINLIRKLNPVSYRYDNRKLYTIKCGFEFGTKDGTLKVNEKNYGFLAQEIDNVAKELNIIYEAVKYDSKRDAYSFGYSQLIASIVKTIKTIDDRIKVLKTKI